MITGTFVVRLVSNAGTLLTWHCESLDCVAFGVGAEGMTVADVLELLRIGMKVDGRAGLLREAGDECKGTGRDGQKTDRDGSKRA